MAAPVLPEDHMQELTFQKTFTKHDAKQYISIPFDLPADTERMELIYSYPRFIEETTPSEIRRRELNIVDIGFFNTKGHLRGWSGSQRTEVFISEYEATPGYRKGPLEAGRWGIALGIYQVAEMVTVDIILKLYPKQRRWLCGDLHMHTLNSDGAYTTKQVIEYCTQAGLDFIALTDHNNIEQNTEIGNPDGITVIPGMEYTNYQGHANFFFPNPSCSIMTNPLSTNEAELQQVFNEAKNAGAAICLNHILDEDCPWLFGFENLPYDMVEVWNGFIKSSDMDGIAWWHQRLCAGHHLAAIGGSDTHRIELGRTYGTPTTYVHALSRAPMDILCALKQGRSSISASPKSARLDLHIGSWGLGEIGFYSDALEGKVYIQQAKQGDSVRLIDPKGVCLQWIIEHDGDIQFSFTAEKKRFYRVELYRKTLGVSLLNALTNPVYLVPDTNLSLP